jgi:peroxiredoxin
MKFAAVAVCLVLVGSFSFAETEGKKSDKAKMRKMLCKKLQEQKLQNKQKEPKKISVQLFVVEIETDLLYKQDFNKLGTADNQVTIDEIIKLIEKGKASVLSRISVNTKERRKVEQEHQKEIEVNYYTNPSVKERVTRVGTTEYEKLSVTSYFINDDEISLDLNYHKRYCEAEDLSDTLPKMPDFCNRSLEVFCEVEPGQPEILSEYLKNKVTEFIIVTSDIAGQ